LISILSVFNQLAIKCMEPLTVGQDKTLQRVWMFYAGLKFVRIQIVHHQNNFLPS